MNAHLALLTELVYVVGQDGGRDGGRNRGRDGGREEQRHPSDVRATWQGNERKVHLTHVF
jgi:hypothetical protein